MAKTLSGRQRLSIVWKYFTTEEKDPGKARCLLCSEILKFSGSTSSMKYHLRRHASILGGEIEFPPVKAHKNRKIKLKNKSPSSTRSTFGVLASPLSPKVQIVEPTRNDQINAHVLSLLALDYHDPSIVEGEGFKALMKYLDPLYTIPTAQELSRRLSLMHEVYKCRLTYALADIQDVSLGIEKWFSNTNNGIATYMTVTIYFIASTWEFQSRVLGTEMIADDKSHGNVTDMILALCKTYNVQETSIVAAVHENDEEVLLSYSFIGFHHFPCFAQTLSNCVYNSLAIPKVAEMVVMCRNLIEFLLINPSLVAIFELKQKQLRLPRRGRCLQTDCGSNNANDNDPVHRQQKRYWASTWGMLNFAYEQHQAIARTFLDHLSVIDENTIVQLPKLPEEEEWFNVKAVVDTLQPLETVREMLCAESYVSLSTVVPILFSLINFHLKPYPSDKELVKNLKNVILHEMKAQFSFDSAAFTESFGIMATVLDPRHKSLPFLNDIQRNIVKTKLATLVEDNRSIINLQDTIASEEDNDSIASLHQTTNEDDQSDEEVIKPTPTVAEFLSVIYSDNEFPTHSRNENRSSGNGAAAEIRSEVDSYFLEELIPLSANPLDWWSVNGYKYTILSKLARRMLCIPATAVRPSQAFASAPWSSARRREMLDANFIDKLVFLNGTFQNGVMPTMENNDQLKENLVFFEQLTSNNNTSE